MPKNILFKSQTGMKTWYDRKAVTRTFNEGENVLVLLPSHGNPLSASYFGLYIILRKIYDLNYIVKTPDGRKPKQMCHVNMLKPYYSRDQLKVVPDQCPVNTVSKAELPSVDFNISECCSSLQNTQLLAQINENKLSHLTAQQQAEMSSLLREYKHLFSDTHGRMDAIS